MTVSPDRQGRVSTPDLARLTGLRSGKGSFYPELRLTAQRLDRAMAAPSEADGTAG